MTDYAVTSDEEMVSRLIVITCQQIPKSFSLASNSMHDLAMTQEPAPKGYTISCGSDAEFYILPLNTCVADLDYLMCYANELAFSGDSQMLPSDMSGLAEAITCYKIEPYQSYPGFVRLQIFGEMNYNWKYKKYELNQNDQTGIYIAFNAAEAISSNVSFVPLSGALHRNTSPVVINGPAITRQMGSKFQFDCDVVRSMFCPRWHLEAQNWPIRPRKQGWPTSDTISEVVQNGCHVVCAQHRSCRDDKAQWRLSFSLAEVILLQSWTPIQQIVYHLLRFFAKKELIQKDCPKNDEVLCPYHLKTLMLWTCEEMPPEWWNSSTVIAICCKLLKKLSEWLMNRCFPNYFIPEANLFHEPPNPRMLYQILRRINGFLHLAILSHWFVENYILPLTIVQCATTGKFVPYLINYLNSIVEQRKALEFQSLDVIFSHKFAEAYRICRCVNKGRVSAGLRVHLQRGQYTTGMNSITHSFFVSLSTTENVLCFTHYSNLLFVLHAAYGLRYGYISWDNSLFVELVSTTSMQPNVIRSQYHNFPKIYTEQSGRFQFLRAQRLMENLTGSNGPSESRLLSLMSKEFLRRAIESVGAKSNGIAPTALAYLAALHFATSDYEQAIVVCMEVLLDQNSRMEKETLNAGCLLFIDDIPRIVGLCLLYKKIIDNNLHYVNGRIYLDLRLSPKVFAYYLAVLAAERISKHIDLHRDIPYSSFPMDEYLMACRKPRITAAMMSGTDLNALRLIVGRRTDSLTERDPFNESLTGSQVKERVIDLLMEYALECMTSFHCVFRKDFGIECNTADCYRALYLYKCCQYNEALHLCERILQESDLQSNFREFAFANILLLPPLDSFFDEYIQSLLGIHTLFLFLSPSNVEYRKSKVATDRRPTFEYLFAKHVYSLGVGLPDFLLVDSYSIKRHFLLGRHFLARYLKIRCCIDCNVSYSEAMNEFAAQKINLPFENIIRMFLLRKLRIRNKKFL